MKMPYNTSPNNDPNESRARYNSQSGKCGSQIRKGDKIYIWPSAPRGKKARCECAEGDYREFLGSKQDEQIYQHQYTRY